MDGSYPAAQLNPEMTNLESSSAVAADRPDVISRLHCRHRPDARGQRAYLQRVLARRLVFLYWAHDFLALFFFLHSSSITWPICKFSFETERNGFRHDFSFIRFSSPLFLLGNPNTPVFNSRVDSKSRTSYKLSWITESYATIEEYRLLYRKLPVSKQSGKFDCSLENQPTQSCDMFFLLHCCNSVCNVLNTGVMEAGVCDHMCHSSCGKDILVGAKKKEWSCYVPPPHSTVLQMHRYVYLEERHCESVPFHF